MPPSRTQILGWNLLALVFTGMFWFFALITVGMSSGGPDADIDVVLDVFYPLSFAYVCASICSIIVSQIRRSLVWTKWQIYVPIALFLFLHVISAIYSYFALYFLINRQPSYQQVVSQETKDSTATFWRLAPGVWQSIDDPRDTIEIRADGTLVEKYSGEPSADSTSTLSVFTAANPDPAFSGTLVHGIMYIKEVGKGGVLFFALGQLSSTTLSWSYTARGNTLSFKRIH